MGIHLSKADLSDPRWTIGPSVRLPDDQPIEKPRKKRERPDYRPAMAYLCRLHGFPVPFDEYKFAADRRFAFDFAWPEHGKLALEVEGQVHRIKGRFSSDMEKYNEAALAGWKVLRCTPKEMTSGAVAGLLKRALQ